MKRGTEGCLSGMTFSGCSTVCRKFVPENFWTLVATCRLGCYSGMKGLPSGKCMECAVLISYAMSVYRMNTPDCLQSQPNGHELERECFYLVHRKASFSFRREFRHKNTVPHFEKHHITSHQILHGMDVERQETTLSFCDIPTSDMAYVSTDFCRYMS